MKRNTLTQQVETMEQRLQAWQRRAGVLSEQPTLLAEAIQDLSVVMSDLSLAAEELRQQNDELAESHQALSNEIAERKRFEEALRATQENLRAVFDLSGVGQAQVEPASGRFISVNHKLCEMTGYTISELLTMTFSQLTHPDDREADLARYRQVLQGKANDWSSEKRYVRKDGEIIWVEVNGTLIRDGAGHPLYSVAVIADITKRRRAEESLHRLNRTLQARSHSDQALMHATNEAEYMQEVCKIIVEDCGHAMVWIGFAEEDEARSVRPVAYAGFELGYLETLHITWADTERGRGPTGTAIRTRQPSFCRNMLTDSQFAPWRAEALKRGYAASLVLPLLDQGRAFGALNVYFREPDPFTEDEVVLLSGLADDLAYGIKTLRLRAAHEQAEAALRESEERAWDQAARLQAVLDAAPAIIWVAHDRECQSITGNHASQELLRVPEGTNVSKSGPAPELLAHYRVFNDGVELAPQDMPIQRVAALGQGINDYAMEIVFDDGSIRSLLGNVTPVLDSAGRPNGAIAAFVDITEHKRAEQERERLLVRIGQERQRAEELALEAQQRAAELDATITAIADAILIYGPSGEITRMNPAAERIFCYSLAAHELPLDARAVLARVESIDGRPFVGTEDMPAQRVLRGEAARGAVIAVRDIQDDQRIWVSARAAPIQLPDGKRWGAVASYADITELRRARDELELRVQERTAELTRANAALQTEVAERKRAEEAVKAERQRFNDVLEMLPAYLVLLSPDYHVPFANRFFRERFGESHGRRCFEYLFGRTEPCPVCDTFRVLKTMTPLEWEWTGPDGRHYDVFDFPFTDIDGSTLILEMGIDITERKQAKAQLERNNEELRALSLAERNQRLLAETLSAANLTLTQSLNLGTVMETLLDYLEQLVPYDSATIILLEAESRMAVRAMRGYERWTDAEPARAITLDVQANSLFNELFTTHQSILVPDTHTYPGWAIRPGTEHVRSWIGVPLIAGGKVIGMYSLDKTEPGFFTQEHVRLAERLVGQAAVAIQNARLFEQVRAGREQLRLLARQVVSVQEQERRRVSRELHDEAGQALTALKISLELMLADLPDQAASLRERIQESVMLTDDTMERIRLLAHDLRPPALDAVGLGPTLEDVCRDFGERTQLSIDYASGELLALPDAVSICLYRVLQEALTNVAKHAHARRVRVALHRDVDSVRLLVEDDGQGFDPQSILSPIGRPAGIGLLGMQDRLELLGGKLEIDSHSGRGTRLVAHVPWEEHP